MNGQYPYQFDEPWAIHPDVDTPINDVQPDLQSGVKFLTYTVAKHTGVLWLVEKLPFLEKRQWVKDIERPF